MTALIHVIFKDPENSGYVWDDFYCPECLKEKLSSSTWLEVIRQTKVIPKYLARLYPPLVNEPWCDTCHRLFTR
jgi:hypothetical protein